MPQGLPTPFMIFLPAWPKILWLEFFVASAKLQNKVIEHMALVMIKSNTVENPLQILTIKSATAPLFSFVKKRLIFRNAG
jgi:hypothetical protein